MKSKNKIRNSISDTVTLVVFYVLLTIVALVVLYPLVYVVSASMSDARAVASGKVWLFPVDISFYSYEMVLSNTHIVRGFLNSVFYTIVGTLISLGLTILAAYGLSRKELPGHNLFVTMMLVTMLFNGGLVPTYLLIDNLNMIDTRLAILLPTALSVWNVFVMRTYFTHAIPEELFESARIDGCDYFRYLWKIVLPLSAPIIAVISLYYGVGRWNAWFEAMLYLTTDKKYPLQIILRNILVLERIDTTMAKDVDVITRMQGLAELLKYAVSVVSSLPLLIAYPFVQKYFVRGVMVGAIKG